MSDISRVAPRKGGAHSQRFGAAFQAALALAAFAILPLAVNAQPATRPSFPAIQLPARTQGESALNSLRGQLPDLAAFYRQSVPELERVLRRDRALWVDRNGRLFYVCDWGGPASGASDTNSAPPVRQMAPLDQTFLLHSRPGATKTIFLDFDGHTISGTAWNDNNNGGADIVAPPWDTDGNPASFGNGELTAIQQVWLRVAEDYAPYDVDVTTEYPGEAALTRSGGGDQIYGVRALISAIGFYFGNPGGIAYVGVFDDFNDYYKPALIFPENLGNNEKNIAEATSHEVGHNLGLNHDGQDIGATHIEYYTGQGNWAPIMGVGYSKPIVQWSKGEYADANNLQDDLVVITQNGLAFRADDFGNSIGSAAVLAGTSIVTNGTIERTTDADFFAFSSGAGTVQITVTPWERGANLHLLVTLYDSLGAVLTNCEVADTGSGVQPVAINRFVSTGGGYVSVEGIGSGDPLTTGYSDYASLGQYTLAITLPGTGSWLPTAGGAYSWSNFVNWASGNVPDAADMTAYITNNIAGDQVISLDSPTIIGRLVLGDANATHAFTIQDGGGGPLTFDVLSGTAALIKTKGTNDLISASLVLNDSIAVSNSSNARLTLAGPISGNGGLTKTGAGMVALAGSDSYLGNTTVAGGALALDATVSFPGSAVFDVRNGALLDVTALSGGLALNANQTVGGSGVVLGDVSLNSGGNLSPGLASTAASLSFSNNLAFNGGALWSVDLGPTNSTGAGSNDLVVVTGDLSLAGANTIVINPLAAALGSPADYTILTYGGALSGGAANLDVSNPTRYAIVPDDSVPGQIDLHVSGGPTNITWRGDGALNRWDIATSFNWLNGAVSDRYYQLDSVTFDNTGSNNTPISLVGAISPSAITINASKTYTFAGPGKFTGAMSLTKFGDGGLILSNANDFTGSIIMNGGTLKPAVSNALGSPLGGTCIQGFGQLDINGFNLGDEPVFLTNGLPTGYIVNSGAPQINALRFVTLGGDAFFGGTSRWDIRANPTASLTGNGFKLTKTGANEIWLVGLGNTGLGNIDLRQGLLGIQSSTTLGNAASSIALWPGTTLAFWDNNANVLNKVLLLTNAFVRTDSGNNAFAGPATLSGSNTFNVVSGLELRGPIGGSGLLLKTGNGSLTLNGSNTFTGALYVDTSSTGNSDGMVKLAGSNALRNASSIIIRNNNGGSSTLQLDGSSGNMTLAQPITLSGRNSASAAIENVSGSNTLAGSITLQVGGGNYWFQSDSGTLALTAATLPASSPSGIRTLTFQGSGDTLISGNIHNIGGTTALTKSGSGRLTLTGTSSAYTGTNIINAGTLQIGNGGAGAKPGPGPFLMNGGTLLFNRSDNFTWNNSVNGSGQFIKLNTNTLTLTSTNRYLLPQNGAAQVNGGTLQINSPGRLIANGEFWVAKNATTGACVVNFGTLIVSNWIAVGRNNSAANGTLTLNNGSIQKYGGGNIILGSLGGTGTLTVNGGTISNNAQLLLAESATGRGFFNLNGGVVQASALAKFGGNNAVARFNGGTLQATANNPNFISGLNQALVQAGGFVLDDASFGLTNSQPLLEDATSPGGGFTKLGAGTVGLNTASTFRGFTRINAGTLRLLNLSALQFSTLNLAAVDTGALSFGPLTVTTLGGLAGTRDLALANDAAAAVALSVGNNNSNSTYFGILSGNGSLTKNGAGTLTLSGANSYTGTTTVNNGVLLVNGALGPGAVNVANGTLGGNGTIGGPVTILSGGTLSPGTSIGLLTVNNSLTLSGTTLMEINHNGPSNDTVNVAGTVQRGGSLIVTNIGPALAAGDSFKLFNAGSLGGTFASVTLPPLNPGLRWNTNQFSTNSTFAVVAVAAPLITASLSGTNLLVQFPTEPGVNYLLQSATNLLAPIVWTPQQTNSGNGTVLSLTIPIDTIQPQKYFRLLAY